MTFNEKALSGFKWSFLDTFFRLIFTFVVSIILARLLEPRDFGLVALAAVFGTLSSTLVDGGFGDSLIRKSEATEEDYNTIFTFNFIISVIIYALLFFTSEIIATFFNEPLIKDIIRFSSITLVISSFSMVQTAILRKQVDFKKQAKITFLSTLLSGALSVYMAFAGFGYWALIIPSIVASVLSGFLLYVMSAWKPKLSMNLNLLKEHFYFGSKIMAGSFVYMLNQNVFNVFLGKFFSPATLGFFYRADNLQKLPSSTLDNVIRHVTYPLLASIQNEDEQLTSKYRLILKFTSFLNSIVLIGIAVNAKLIVLLLFGEKWLPSVPYLQLLCFAGVFIPLISINLNILNVKGRSDLTFLLTLTRLAFNFIAMVFGYYFGISSMIYAIVLALLIEYIIVSYINQSIVSYKLYTQLGDTSKGVINALLFGLIIFFVSEYIFVENKVLNVFIVTILNITVLILVNELFRNNEYRYIKESLAALFKRNLVK
jgi:teichuronic acid exporter